MTNIFREIGFEYFSSPKYFVRKQVNEWMPVLRKHGASSVIFKSGFDHAIPEDIFLIAQENGLSPIIHFKSELPLAKNFNDVAFLLDVYGKWGANEIVLGNKPNSKQAWLTSGWQYENLVDHFLDRFIPLANHAVRIGLTPILAPLQPGGDYWDTAFLEMVLKGLQRRRLDPIIENINLASYGYSFNKPLSWGRGGPEQWSGSKPYQTPEGQEDQMGFHNYAWMQAVGERVTGRKIPVIILDAGHPGTNYSEPETSSIIKDIKHIYTACSQKTTPGQAETQGLFNPSDSIRFVTFSLETAARIMATPISSETFASFFHREEELAEKSRSGENSDKFISHYLLLPSHMSGISDVILNKIRPLIKKFQPTVGFSVKEASNAKKVSIYPDPLLLNDGAINELRSAGCVVEILPESGIEIATLVQGI